MIHGYAQDYSCDQAGYLQYLSQWSESEKCTSRDPTSSEFQTRLTLFVDSCEKIYEWNAQKRYQMEFTFYADWSYEEFEAITQTTQRYSGIKPEIPVTIPVYNNSGIRHLLPSTTPCDEQLQHTICRPQQCSVSWAFAVTESIELAIRKMYLENHDQSVEISLSAQELIDCVPREYGVENSECYDFIRSIGIYTYYIYGEIMILPFSVLIESLFIILPIIHKRILLCCKHLTIFTEIGEHII